MSRGYGGDRGGRGWSSNDSSLDDVFVAAPSPARRSDARYRSDTARIVAPAAPAATATPMIATTAPTTMTRIAVGQSGTAADDDDDNVDHPGKKLTPSPTGYRDYTPPAELVRNRYNDPSSRHDRRNGDQRSGTDDEADGYGNFTETRRKDEDFTHKTILLGDSGVGKTSLLVQFDTGQFQTGNFAATVGIGFTVMLLGDSGVGKTCLLTRFRDGRFLGGNYITTVGIDFRNKIINVDESRVKLQIWDTAGQERFRSVTHAYYRDAHALLLLYDVTNNTSYDNIRAWLGEIREYAHDDVVIMLLGNKCDCGSERTVKREDGERLAKEYNVPFMETSAKTGLNVELAFFAVARQLKARKSGGADPTKFNVHDYVKEQSQKNSCTNYNCLTT